MTFKTRESECSLNRSRGLTLSLWHEVAHKALAQRRSDDTVSQTVPRRDQVESAEQSPKDNKRASLEQSLIVLLSIDSNSVNMILVRS